MKKILILYSVNTWLAYYISKNYYNDIHYVWCSPYFDSNKAVDSENPPSSNPYDIYFQFKEDVMREDINSSKIKNNILGIQNGAVIKRRAGEISDRQYKDIKKLIIKSETNFKCFRPLLYIIPYKESLSIKEVSIDKKANPFSNEYIIDKLMRKDFDIIEF